MRDRLIAVFVAPILFVTPFNTACAADGLGWNGVWAGTLGKSAKISVIVADNKVKSYRYDGALLGITYNIVNDGTLSFGDGRNYSMTLKRAGEGAAKGTYHGHHGF